MADKKASASEQPVLCDLEQYMQLCELNTMMERDSPAMVLRQKKCCTEFDFCSEPAGFETVGSYDVLLVT